MGKYDVSRMEGLGGRDLGCLVGPYGTRDLKYAGKFRHSPVRAVWGISWAEFARSIWES